jgi:hypothetical protein
MTFEEADQQIATLRKAAEVPSDEFLYGCVGLTKRGLRGRIAEILRDVRRLAANRHEGFLPLNGDPRTHYDGYILWVWLYEERAFMWLEQVVRALSDGFLTAKCEGDHSPGIHITIAP